MILSRYEQESIINFNEEEKTASVYTHNGALRRKLEKLSLERPEECQPEGTRYDGQAVSYIVSKSWIKVSPLRKISEKTRERLREASKSHGFQKKDMTGTHN